MTQEKFKVLPKVPTSDPQQRATLVCFLVLLIGILLFAMRTIRPYLLALTMGGILAVLSHRVHFALIRWNLRPKLASFVVTIGILFLVIGPLVIFSNLAIEQGVVFAKSLSENETLSLRGILDQVSEWSPVKTLIPDSRAFERQAIGWIQSAGKSASTIVLNVASSVPQVLLQITLALISCFFFLIDGKRFLKWSSNKIPLDQDVRRRVADSFRSTAISVIWATLSAAGAQAGVILFSFLVLGVPMAFLAAGATFILAWIPIVGSTPVWVSAAVYLFTQGSIAKMILMIVFGIVTGLVDNIVRPWVLKGRGSLHPLVSLVAIFGGIQTFGFLGVFLGPILAAILISLLQIWPLVGQRYGLLSKSPELSREGLTVKSNSP